MGGYIYCLYSTEDCLPRYVGRADRSTEHRFKQHIAAGLSKHRGPLYDWIRDVWRSGFEVGHYTLQRAVNPSDRDMFEQYWIQQFDGLLNVKGLKEHTATTPLGAQVIAAIREIVLGTDGAANNRT